ncbi:iron complex transport system substrate-binding protein [Devosia lucknowensis]|uniref:Iron complex transport system substrate-binding protein n=1 Tax=Devosia lucknowensis TaxID=1096929 RepID=A0A1Y6GCA6_9HYPH|nr:iron-siderophore ABC transporter substrate-binding protein [Devosia lucknowensis]SMQ85410.1 iron complex transport system substrate-binding protein [Devosia lucknowensis]
MRTLITLAFAAVLATSAQAREVTHAMGVTEVPDNPQRVVILTNEGTEALLFLGVTPVGAVQSWSGDPWYDHIAEPLADTVNLGTELAVNLEILATLEPDLILGTKVRQESIYPQLSAIAPTVMTETIGGDWQKNLQFYADTIGQSDAGKAAVTGFIDRTQRLHDALGDAVNEEISLVRFAPNRTRIYYKDTFAGLALGQIGFKRAAAQDKNEFAEEVTTERIPEMEGDRIFYFSDDLNADEATANLDEWLNDPLWLNLEGVRAGKAQRVSEIVWNTAGGIYAAHLMLDDIERIYGLASTR